MQDLSLHLLDIVENSIRAKASLVQIEVNEAVSKDLLTLIIKDNGKGMNASLLKTVTDPFTTTRTTRKIGLGIPLLKQNCLLSGGTLEIKSKVNQGTTVMATMQYHHIDRLPLGDMASSMSVLIQANPEVDFIYKHQYEEKEFIMSTLEIKKTLQEIPINQLEVIEWVRQYISENIQDIRQNDEIN